MLNLKDKQKKHPELSFFSTVCTPPHRGTTSNFGPYVKYLRLGPPASTFNSNKVVLWEPLKFVGPNSCLTAPLPPHIRHWILIYNLDIARP